MTHHETSGEETGEQAPVASAGGSRSRGVTRLLSTVIVAFVFFVGIRSFVVEAYRIPTGSMENTLLVGDFLFVNKAVFGGELEIPLTGIRCCRLPSFATPQRDAVVIFRSVEDSTPDTCEEELLLQHTPVHSRGRTGSTDHSRQRFRWGVRRRRRP